MSYDASCRSVASARFRSLDGIPTDFTGVRRRGVRSEPLLDTHTIWGIRRVFQLAGDRPAVVSLSLGGHLGPHDGTTALEAVIARETGPGRIVVVAAGNEGEDGVHWTGELDPAGELVIPVRVSDDYLQWVDVWVPRGDEVEITIETPDGVRHDPDGLEHATAFGTFLANWREDPINRDQNLTLFIGGGLVNRQWRIRVEAKKALHGVVHAWAGTPDPNTSAFLFPTSKGAAYSIGMPATADRAIAVGSYVSKTTIETAGGLLQAKNLAVGQLSPFSSRGPARHGAQKPDIAAPGQFITAALAAKSELATSPHYVPRHHPTLDGYITIQGTSMATPFVAGVIALMLEREPKLTPEEIQRRFRITARRDKDTGRVWGDGFGVGKLDVDALLNYKA